MKAKLDVRKSGSFKIGGDIEVHRLGFVTMRIPGMGFGPSGDVACGEDARHTRLKTLVDGNTAVERQACFLGKF